jgi:hypothetical protein
MSLVWMPPRKLKLEDLVYPELRHWLVDGDGRLLACVQEPAPDNPEDSFDARLYYRSTDDFAYFISLDHARTWCERETAAHLAQKLKDAPDRATETVPQSVPQVKN